MNKELAFTARWAHLGILEHLIDYFGPPELQPILKQPNITKKTVHLRDRDPDAAKNNALNVYGRCAEPSVQCTGCEFGNIVWFSPLTGDCLCQDCFITKKPWLGSTYQQSISQQSFLHRTRRMTDSERYAVCGGGHRCVSRR